MSPFLTNIYLVSWAAVVTSKPTKQPVPAPTTSIPTARPSMTGIVATFQVTKPVTTSLSNADIQAIEDAIVTEFDTDEVAITGIANSTFSFKCHFAFWVDYVATGTITVLSELSEEETENAIKAELVSALGVHTSDVTVECNFPSAICEYTISSDDAESLVDVVNTMGDDAFVLSPENVLVHELTAPTEVVAVIDVSVDGSNASDVDAAVQAAITAVQEQDEDYDVTGDGNFSLLFDSHRTKNFVFTLEPVFFSDQIWICVQNGDNNVQKASHLNTNWDLHDL